MIRIGPIRKMWRGKRLLLIAFVDDDSSLKSQFTILVKGIETKKLGIVIGKGYNAKTKRYPRLVVGQRSLFWGYRDGAHITICGIGHWEEVDYIL